MRYTTQVSSGREEEATSLHLRLVAARLRRRGPICHALCARMGDEWVGGYACRIDKWRARREAAEPIGEGTLEVIRIRRPTYEKQRLAERLVWTIVSNLLLVKAAFGSMRRADAVLFTGSPPLMLHFIAPLNLITRTKLIYRITDFHPECLIAERGQAGFLLNVLLRLTRFWRRRVDMFEVLGLDQARRLVESGIPEERIQLKRNPSPVVFSPRLRPLPLPDALRDGSGVILYSGNWGVAHDDDTFIEAYSEYFRQSRHGLKFWLNAVGSKADRVENELRRRGVFVYRTVRFRSSSCRPS